MAFVKNGRYLRYQTKPRPTQVERMSSAFNHHQVIRLIISEIASDMQEMASKSPSSLKTNKQDSELIIKLEEILSSQLVSWMSWPLLKPVKITDYCMMKKVDLPWSKSIPNKLTSNSAKFLLKLLDQTRSHTLLLMMLEPSDSHIQTSTKEIPSSMIWKRIKLSAGLATSQDIWPMLPVETTSVELEQSFTSKDIWVVSILFT